MFSFYFSRQFSPARPFPSFFLSRQTTFFFFSRVKPVSPLNILVIPPPNFFLRPSLTPIPPPDSGNSPLFPNFICTCSPFPKVPPPFLSGPPVPRQSPHPFHLLISVQRTRLSLISSPFSLPFSTPPQRPVPHTLVPPSRSFFFRFGFLYSTPLLFRISPPHPNLFPPSLLVFPKSFPLLAQATPAFFLPSPPSPHSRAKAFPFCQ